MGIISKAKLQIFFFAFQKTQFKEVFTAFKPRSRFLLSQVSTPRTEEDTQPFQIHSQYYQEYFVWTNVDIPFLKFFSQIQYQGISMPMIYISSEHTVSIKWIPKTR